VPRIWLARRRPRECRAAQSGRSRQVRRCSPRRSRARWAPRLSLIVSPPLMMTRSPAPDGLFAFTPLCCPCAHPRIGRRILPPDCHRKRKDRVILGRTEMSIDRKNINEITARRDGEGRGEAFRGGLQDRLDVAGERIRPVGRGVAAHDVVILGNQELGEVPFDRLSAKQPRGLLL
jgi:hypothetical protein